MKYNIIGSCKSNLKVLILISFELLINKKLLKFGQNQS